MEEVEHKDRKLKSYSILPGTRGQKKGGIPGCVRIIEKITPGLHPFPEIQESDMNPVRILENPGGIIALDAKLRIKI